MKTIQVHKVDHLGREKWRYSGTEIARGLNWIQIEAFFDQDDSDDGYIVWRRGDRFIEWYYSQRWYNVFEIHDVTHGHLKGWYCNITFPAVIEPQKITWADLELDVWVSAVGDILLIDEAEFEALEIDHSVRAQALAAVDEIRSKVNAGEAPFDGLVG